jgi:hypothetical protein
MKFHQITATPSQPRDVGVESVLVVDRRYSHQDVSEVTALTSWTTKIIHVVYQNI